MSGKNPCGTVLSFTKALSSKRLGVVKLTQVPFHSPFTYELKVSSRTGLETSELIISTREKGKTITRSSVELALERYLELMAECGYVKGPKSAGQVFGASYLYAVFLAWKIIRDKPVEI